MDNIKNLISNTHLCCYSNNNMTISKNVLIESFINVAGGQKENVHSFSFEDIQQDQTFYNFNKDVLEKDRGSGYWMWKPYIILDTLNKVDFGTYVLYCDSGVQIVHQLDELYKLGDFVVFNNEWAHIDWCKMDVLKGMLPQYELQQLINIRQVQASVFLIKKTEYTVKLIREWLSWSQVTNFIDDTPSRLPNHSRYREHRHDQAIICNLIIREGIKTHWWPAQYNIIHKTPDTKYGVLFNHHRKRNNQW